jgi:hypothetical protein
MRLSKGLIRSISILALARAMFVASTKMENTDMIKDGTIEKEEYDLTVLPKIQAYRKEFNSKIINFIEKNFMDNPSQKEETKSISNQTTNYAMGLLKKQEVDLDFIGIYLLKKLIELPKVSQDIKSLVEIDKINELSKLVDDTYRKDALFRVKNRIKHVIIVNSIFSKVFK